MSHTPGPWLIAPGIDESNGHIYILDSRPTDPGDPDAGGPIIAELWHADEPTLSNDARLIAAAPDLLDALQAIRARIEGEWDNPALVAAGPLMTNSWRDVSRFIDTAITKATKG